MKDNKTLAGLVGVMVVGSLGLGAYLYTSYSSFSEKRAQWDQITNQTNALKGKKLFPNQENFEELQAQVEDYSGKVNILRAALSSEKVQLPITPISETDFQAKLKERINVVRQAATNANVKLPEGFALGFDSYTGALPISEEAAANLNVQLDVIERLVMVLIESRVKSIESLERPRLKSEDAATAQAATPANSRAGAGRNNNNAAQNAQKAAEDAAILEHFPVKLTVVTDQAPFQNLLNTLADPSKMSHFVVLRNLSLQNEALEAPLTSEVTNRINEQSNAANSAIAPEGEAAPAPAGGANVATPLPIDAVTIMGEEKLTLNLVVDYLRIKSNPEDNAEKADAQAKQ